MKVRNVHQRALPVAAARVGALIDRLGGPDDALWPGHNWPPMRLQHGLAIGSRGGHGPIRYVVEAHVPGRSVRFRFERPQGFDGHHALEVEATGDACCILRHQLVMRTHGLARLSWPLLFRPLHDALVEDALTLAQHNLGLRAQLRPWSIAVRALRALLSRGRAGSQSLPEPRTFPPPVTEPS
jgi:hypothetical protein